MLKKIVAIALLIVASYANAVTCDLYQKVSFGDGSGQIKQFVEVYRSLSPTEMADLQAFNTTIPVIMNQVKNKVGGTYRFSYQDSWVCDGINTFAPEIVISGVRPGGAERVWQEIYRAAINKTNYAIE